ncbi:hypothetical protein DASC09_020850 [Saccharomycopsis crataegensis]|uniref:Leucine-rich repeat domain-containing protein n=1 Tax=Saccharomycopsis crataegensis TaxID=43959 RepID=A0AAV5QK63_9ASCO|nr:hypothetical protein DASC09_020850 [Saccharomycopsis crataegensis]
MNGYSNFSRGELMDKFRLLKINDLLKIRNDSHSALVKECADSYLFEEMLIYPFNEYQKIYFEGDFLEFQLENIPIRKFRYYDHLAVDASQINKIAPFKNYIRAVNINIRYNVTDEMIRNIATSLNSLPFLRQITSDTDISPITQPLVKLDTRIKNGSNLMMNKENLYELHVYHSLYHPQDGVTATLSKIENTFIPKNSWFPNLRILKSFYCTNSLNSDDLDASLLEELEIVNCASTFNLQNMDSERFPNLRKLSICIKDPHKGNSFKEIGVCKGTISIFTLDTLYLNNARGISLDFRSLEYLTDITIRHWYPLRIDNFGFLHRLEIVDLSYNSLSKIEGLEDLRKLKKLNLSHNNIEKIQNLEKLVNLENLNLGFNSIKKIENLDRLLNLNVLSLSKNYITKLENVESSPKLEHLFLLQNPLKRSINSVEYGKLREKIDDLRISWVEGS